MNKTQSVKELWCPVMKRNMQISSRTISGVITEYKGVQSEKEGRVYAVWRREDNLLGLSSLSPSTIFYLAPLGVLL